jgi:hypothetical protein
MAATNKRLLISESHGVLNRCTPYRGKPDQHDMYASHASPRMPSVRFLRVPRMWQPFTSHRQSWAGPLLPRKRALDTIHNALADRSVGLYPASLLSQLMKQWGQSQASISGKLLGLLGPYHQHAIGTFNTCSLVPTPRSLTNTGGGYHIENLGIATALSPPFPSEGSTDPPKWPRPISIFIQH